MSEDNPVTKGNDYAIEALKQLLTLATVVLALTITFLKDALGEAQVQALWTGLVPFAWACLILVLWTAWVAIGDAAKGLATGTLKGYVFAGGRSRNLARTAHWSFVVALACLALFATVNLGLLFSSGTKVAEEIKARRFVVVDQAGKVVWKVP